MNIALRRPWSYQDLFEGFAARATPERFAAARPGRSMPNPETCLQIQCGALPPGKAGFDLVADCSFAGFEGSQSCADPLCAPYCGVSADRIARASFPLPIAEKVAAKFARGPRGGCEPIYTGYPFGGPYSDRPEVFCPSSWINDNPLMAVGLALGAAWLVWRAR